jgi:deoxyribodipyrimidine photo-lyase
MPAEIDKILDNFDPVEYARTRNFKGGNVTKLSPYISRGVISLSHVKKKILSKQLHYYSIKKFIQELAWREYFQRVHLALGDRLFCDMNHPQPGVENYKISSNITTADTGIIAVDTGIKQLVEEGYMHNHCRMYVSSLACNFARSYWKIPSQWMYYHLLDADAASNTCNWQWIAGSFSNQKYYANQENINRYFNTDQSNTFLDNSYEAIREMNVPDELRQLEIPTLNTLLPETNFSEIKGKNSIIIYNNYNLDPSWRTDDDAERVLLLEPSHFEKFPMCKKTIDFIVKLFTENIEHAGLPKIFKGEFSELRSKFPQANFIYKKHPLYAHYEGAGDEPDWMFPAVEGFFPSFHQYWKKCEKYLADEKY